MLSLLLSMAVVTPIPVVQPPPSSPQICDELLYELDQGVQFEVITEEQALEVYLRCVVKYL